MLNIGVFIFQHIV